MVDKKRDCKKGICNKLFSNNHNIYVLGALVGLVLIAIVFGLVNMTGNVVSNVNDDSNVISVNMERTLEFKFPQYSLEINKLWLHDIDKDSNKVRIYVNGNDFGFNDVGQPIYVGFNFVDNNYFKDDGLNNALFTITPLSITCPLGNSVPGGKLCDEGGSATFRIDSAGRIKIYVNNVAIFNFPDGSNEIYPSSVKGQYKIATHRFENGVVDFTLRKVKNNVDTILLQRFNNVPLNTAQYFSNASVGEIEVRPVVSGTDNLGNYVIYQIKLGGIPLVEAKRARFDFNGNVYQLYLSTYNNDGTRKASFTVGEVDYNGDNQIIGSFLLSIGTSQEVGPRFFITPVSYDSTTEIVLFKVAATSLGGDTTSLSCGNCVTLEGTGSCATVYATGSLIQSDWDECMNDYAASGGDQALLNYLLEGVNKFNIGEIDLSQLLGIIQDFNQGSIPATSTACGTVQVSECKTGTQMSGIAIDPEKVVFMCTEFYKNNQATEDDIYGCIDKFREISGSDDTLVLTFKECTEDFLSGRITPETFNACKLSVYAGELPIVPTLCGNVDITTCGDAQNVANCVESYRSLGSITSRSSVRACFDKFNEDHIGEDDSAGFPLSNAQTLEGCFTSYLLGVDHPTRGNLFQCIDWFVAHTINSECHTTGDCEVGYTCDSQTATCVLISEPPVVITHCGDVLIEDCSEYIPANLCLNSYLAGLAPVEETLACLSIYNIQNPDSVEFQCYQNGEKYPIGARVADGGLKYCGVDGVLRSQKPLGTNNCQMNMECLSNDCRNGGCVDVASQVAAQGSELERQAGVLKNILCWVKNPPISEGNKLGRCLCKYPDVRDACTCRWTDNLDQIKTCVTNYGGI